MCLHVSEFQNGVKLVSFTRRCVYQELTLNVPHISESCIEIKIKWNFYFHTSTWCLKRFYEVFKTFIKPFETPQRNVKIKILLIFFSSSGIGTGRVKKCSFFGKFGMLCFLVTPVLRFVFLPDCWPSKIHGDEEWFLFLASVVLNHVQPLVKLYISLQVSVWNSQKWCLIIKCLLVPFAINASLISSGIFLQLLSILKCILKRSKVWKNRTV